MGKRREGEDSLQDRLEDRRKRRKYRVRYRHVRRGAGSEDRGRR